MPKYYPKWKKWQDMILQQFLVLHDVEDNIQKVYHIPPIRKLKNLWVKKGGFPENRWRSKVCPVTSLLFAKGKKNNFWQGVSLYSKVFENSKIKMMRSHFSLGLHL